MRAGKAGAETRYHSSVARREIWVGSLLLASVVCSALPRSDAYRWGTEEAIARLDRLKEEAAEQEKLVEALRKVLTPASQSAMTCSAHDHECHSHKRRVQDRRRKGGNSKFSDPENPVRFVRQMELPDKAKVSVVEWLPFKDMIVHGRLMNTLLLAGDVKGQLHIIDSKSGTTILSLSSGHVGAVTAMVVTKRHDQTCTVATGGAQGDIRIHVISRPPRYTLKQQLDLKGTNASSKAAAWVPLVRLITHFAPSTVNLLDGLGPAHLRANLDGPKAIESLDFIPRGKNSYNILASDSDGRLTVHLKNGSLIASRHLETSRPIQRHAVTKTWTALSLDKKLFIFEPRLRNVEPVTCFRYLRAKEVRQLREAEAEAEAAAQGAEEEEEATIGQKQQPKKRKKGGPPARPRVAVNFTVESLSIDASAADTAPALFVGTSDGRMLMIRIVLERGNSNVTCNVLHDVPVVHGASAAAASPVAVLALRDKAVAVSSTGLTLYNVSKAANKEPYPIHDIPLNLGPKEQPLEMELRSDGAHGIALVVASKSVWLFHLDLPAAEESSDWWSIEMLENLRTPVMLVGLMLVLWWQLSKQNANSKGGLGQLFNMAAKKRGFGGGAKAPRYDFGGAARGLGAGGAGRAGSRPW